MSGNARLINTTFENHKQYIGQIISNWKVLNVLYFPNIKPVNNIYQCVCECIHCHTQIQRSLYNFLNSAKTYFCPNKNCLYNHYYQYRTKYKEYIGSKIANLTILDIIRTNAHNQCGKFEYFFKCQCDCGNICEKRAVDVLNGKISTCADRTCTIHFDSFANTVMKYDSYVGQKINNITILESITNPEEIPSRRYIFKCQCDCGNVFLTQSSQFLYRLPYACPNCDSNSNCENKFELWLKQNNFNYICRQKILSKNQNIQHKIEIDFIINNILGIELHGLMTHITTESHHTLTPKPYNYHLNKLESAIENHLELLQFWNFELFQKPDIVKSIILNRLNLTPYKEYARNCYVQEIDKVLSDEFLIKNHIQGTIKSDSVRLGLFYKKNNNLVAVMTFGKARYSNHQWELYRYANYVYTSIVGAASKLFKHFIKNYNPESIVSYSDRRIFDSGKVYEVLGFKLDHISKPDYWYFKSTKSEAAQKIFHRSTFMKHKLSTKLPNFDPNLTEMQNMELHKFYRIYDCGNKVYVWNKEN